MFPARPNPIFDSDTDSLPPEDASNRDVFRSTARQMKAGKSYLALTPAY